MKTILILLLIILLQFNNRGWVSGAEYTSLAAGSYDYLVRDSFDCGHVGASVTITQPTGKNNCY